MREGKAGSREQQPLFRKGEERGAGSSAKIRKKSPGATSCGQRTGGSRERGNATLGARKGCHARGRGARLRTMRILIAEDDMTSRTVLAEVLRKRGHEVVATANGREAWEAMRAPGAPEMAVLDWMMPEMDGLEVVKKIRELKADYPPYLLLLTARGDKNDLVAGLEAGANDYVTKPFHPGELSARVEVGARMMELQAALGARIRDLGKALEEIKTLRGIVPICAGCRKVRDDKGYWEQVEVYVEKRTDAQFSHGLCPECLGRLYPDLKEDEAGPK